MDLFSGPNRLAFFSPPRLSYIEHTLCTSHFALSTLHFALCTLKPHTPGQNCHIVLKTRPGPLRKRPKTPQFKPPLALFRPGNAPIFPGNTRFLRGNARFWTATAPLRPCPSAHWMNPGHPPSYVPSRFPPLTTRCLQPRIGEQGPCSPTPLSRDLLLAWCWPIRQAFTDDHSRAVDNAAHLVDP